MAPKRSHISSKPWETPDQGRVYEMLHVGSTVKHHQPLPSDRPLRYESTLLHAATWRLVQQLASEVKHVNQPTTQEHKPNWMACITAHGCLDQEIAETAQAKSARSGSRVHCANSRYKHYYITCSYGITLEALLNAMKGHWKDDQACLVMSTSSDALALKLYDAKHAARVYYLGRDAELVKHLQATCPLERPHLKAFCCDPSLPQGFDFDNFKFHTIVDHVRICLQAIDKGHAAVPNCGSM
jgi:hypothetical protein